MSMMPLTVALVVASRPLWEPTHTCIQNLPVRIALEQPDTANLDALLDRIELHRVDVVLLELSLLSVPLEEFTRRLRATTSSPAVFVLHNDASPQHIMEAIHAGAAEFLYPPLVEPLRMALERLANGRARAATQSAGLGRVIGFISAKGGCGATTFAAHVATCIAKETKQPVLLADFDFEAGLLRFLLKARTSYSVRDALDNMHRMDSNYWKALTVKYAGLVDVIPAPEDVGARRPGTAPETAQLMRFIRMSYGFSVMDFGRHYSCSALDSLPELDTLYIVTTFDLDALEQARECLNLVAARDYATRTRILLNRVPERGAPDPKGIESFLGVPLAGAFCVDSDALYEAWSEGHLLDDSAKLGKELRRLAQSVVAASRREVRGEVQETKAATKAPESGPRRWLSALLGGRA